MTSQKTPEEIQAASEPTPLPAAGGVRDEAVRSARAGIGRRGHELWIFGYGSLMWRPGFDFVEAVHARLTGYRRCFCVTSVHHRGNERRPGLVLGLDRGGVCEGVAFRVADDEAPRVLAYLRQRELVSGVYQEALLPVDLLRGGHGETQVLALAYVAERAHPSYAGRLPLARQARLIRGARGLSGCNVDYLLNTLCHLAELGIREPELERLGAIVCPLAAREPGPERRSSRLLVRLDRSSGGIPRALRPAERRRFMHRLWLAGRGRLE